MDLVVRQMQTNRCTQVVVGTDPMILSYLLKICNWTMNLYLTLNFGLKFAKMQTNISICTFDVEKMSLLY